LLHYTLMFFIVVYILVYQLIGQIIRLFEVQQCSELGASHVARAYAGLLQHQRRRLQGCLPSAQPAALLLRAELQL
ncbi:unnamed protein product, partial [Effrenium voratum]